MIVLWLFMLRGISLEFRNHLDSPAWAPGWDVAFAGASAALAGFLGAAIGNVVRGVPLDNSGYFFLPLLTNFRVGKEVAILGWFTISVGFATFFAMGEHCLRRLPVRAPLPPQSQPQPYRLQLCRPAAFSRDRTRLVRPGADIGGRPSVCCLSQLRR